MSSQTNEYIEQVQCIYALNIIILCACGARMTCEGACELYCAEYAALYRQLR
jgi:hypothetical protein